MSLGLAENWAEFLRLKLRFEYLHLEALFQRQFLVYLKINSFEILHKNLSCAVIISHAEVSWNIWNHEDTPEGIHLELWNFPLAFDYIFSFFTTLVLNFQVKYDGHSNLETEKLFSEKYSFKKKKKRPRSFIRVSCEN